MHATAPLRLPRASVFAGVCVGVSAAGHVLSSGHGAAPTGLAAGFALVLAAAHGLSHRERGLGALIGLMLWCQLALHTLFTLTAPGPSATHGAHSAVDAVGRVAAHADGHAAAHEGFGTLGLGPGMLLAHVLAGLVSAWWLRQGERCAFDLPGLLRALLDRLFPPPRPGPPPRTPVTAPRFARTAHRPRGVLSLRHVRVLRGPPAPFLT